MVQLFYAISRAVDIRFKIFYFNSFVYSLAFQRRILNCSTAKIREGTAEIVHTSPVYCTTFAQLWLISTKNQFLSGAVSPAWNNFY